MRKFVRRFTYFVSVLFFLMVSTIVNLGPVYADSQNNNVPANNGTLKVHEIGTPSGTESNDPKVCAFNFEGFGFDPSDSGFINIDGQGQTKTNYDGKYAFGPTNNSGYAITQDFNNGGSTVTIADGQYKATLYGKDSHGHINLNDDKAKSKVFKVDCATPTTLPTPQQNDPCGPNNASWVLPANTTALTWSLSHGNLIASTTKGYEFTDGTTTHDYGQAVDSGKACVQQVSVPAVPNQTDPCGPNNAVWNKPSDTTSVVWTINSGRLIASTAAGYEFADGTITHDYGTVQDSNAPCTVPVPATPNQTDPCGPSNAAWDVPADSSTVTWTVSNGHLIASTTSGYAFPGGATTHDYGVATDSNKACLVKVTPTAPTFNDVCGIYHDTFTIPHKTGVEYKVGGHAYWSGTYPGHGTVNIFASAVNGYTLDGTSSWSFDFSNIPCNTITLCHVSPWGGWDKVSITDDGPFADWLLKNHVNDHGDIIPTFDYFNGDHYAGKNLNKDFGGMSGQQILDHDCKKPCKHHQQQQPQAVQPAGVTFTAPTCQNPLFGSYTVPTTTHVIYKNGSTVVTGTNTVSVPVGSTVPVTITAYPESNAYTLTGTASWSQTFTTPEGCGGGGQITPPVTPPAGGQGAGPVVTTSAPVAPQQPELTDTGISVVATSFIALVLSLAAAGVMFGKRQHSSK